MSIIPVVSFKSCSLEVDSEHLSKKDLYETGKRLVDAFSTVGFVYLTDTGIRAESLAQLRKVANEFFESSVEEKAKFAVTTDKANGYIGSEKENLDLRAKSTDSKEAYCFGGHRVFKDSNKWPDNISVGLSDVVKQLMIDCKMLGLRVLDSLSLGMELLEESYLKNFHKLMHEEGNFSTLRLNYYPPCQSTLKAGQLRLGEHTDYGTISMLFQDNIGGLQLEHNGEFVDAPPLEGAVLINIGDSLHLQSCGQMKSKKHRVIVPKDELRQKMARHSYAYFVHPDNDVVINQPLLYQDEEKNKVNYKDLPAPVTSLQHLIDMNSTTF